MSLTQFPFVSILISTKNRRGDLSLLLQSLQKQNYPRDKMEIVVVEETSNPKPISGVKYIPIPSENRGFGHTRNIAIENSSHSLIAFIDDDCIAEPNWLEALVGPLTESNEVFGVAGAVKVRDCNLTGTCENVLGFPGGGLLYAHKSEGKIIPTSLLSTLNCAYQKTALKEVGGFSEATRYGSEDYLLAQKVSARHRCVYNPAAVVYHKTRGSLKNVFLWFYRRALSDKVLTRLLDSPWRHILAILRSSLLLKFILGTLALSFLPALSWPVALGICFFLYYSWNLYRYKFSFHYLRNVSVFLYTPVVKFAMDLGMDCGHLAILLRGGRI